MSEQTQEERRSRERFLCSDHFEAPVVHLPEGDFKVTAINFNRAGIGVFSSMHLPPFQGAHISFRYTEEQPIELAHLPCTVVYIQDTEVGDQYGISFDWQALPEETKALLLQLENIVAASAKEDRYGLF